MILPRIHPLRRCERKPTSNEVGFIIFDGMHRAGPVEAREAPVGRSDANARQSGACSGRYGGEIFRVRLPGQRSNSQPERPSKPSGLFFDVWKTRQDPGGQATRGDALAWFHRKARRHFFIVGRHTGCPLRKTEPAFWRNQRKKGYDQGTPVPEKRPVITWPLGTLNRVSDSVPELSWHRCRTERGATCQRLVTRDASG